MTYGVSSHPRPHLVARVSPNHTQSHREDHGDKQAFRPHLGQAHRGWAGFPVVEVMQIVR